MYPIALELFGCRGGLVEQPAFPPPFDPHTYAEDVSAWYDSNVLPIVPTAAQESFPDRIARFKTEAEKVDFLATGNIARTIPITNTTIEFAEYELTHSDAAPQNVYALTSGYLHFLHDGKAYDELLGGAAPNAGEEILVLKPLSAIRSAWKVYQPGNGTPLEECVYSSMTIDFAALQSCIAKSTTLAYHKKIYEEKTQTTWGGSEADWPAAYLQLFRDHPDVPIVVQGGQLLGSMTPATSSGQRLTMSFRMGEAWNGHADQVSAFFKGHQRHKGLGGHPLIAKLLNVSLATATVDLILPSADVSAGNALTRPKHKLGTDFVQLMAAGQADYHPLALDPDCSPVPRLVVRKPPAGPVPEYLQWNLPGDFIYTRLKVSNPLGSLDPPGPAIGIVGHDPAEVTVTLKTAATDPEPVFEFQAATGLPVGAFERTVQITVDGDVAQELTLSFLDFIPFPVKFYKLADSNPTHVTEMTPAKLDEVLKYANEIFGQQTNTYLYPVEDNGVTLHDYQHPTDLGDPVPDGDALHAVFSAAPNQTENLRVFFVWDYGTGDARGATIPKATPPWALILVDTLVMPAVRSLGGTPRPAQSIARTVVHEIGHWFAETFLHLKADLPPCTGGHQHFDHETTSLRHVGCAPGDWEFYANLMSTGDTSLLITDEQALVIYTHAPSVLTPQGGL